MIVLLVIEVTQLTPNVPIPDSALLSSGRGWNSPVSTTAYTKSAKEVFAEVSRRHRCCLSHECQRRGDIAQGSGVVVGTNEVVTNCHVVSGATEIVVTPSGGRS